ncbi:CopD family protein [Stenoxybacter acetivorans]|uniref:CopD family protein n=1 Tax=Stenoxybacter acetivorans TaxID=422441 RepID=UPI00056539EC|nr:CopD family protein [Stenoxybacter acetivorans]
MYLWLKLIHVFFVIAWFAGLFYLPRIYVNLAMSAPASAEYQRLLVMAQKLLRFMTPLGILALIAGVWVVFVNHWWSFGWVHVKLLLGLLLFTYNMGCLKLLRNFERGQNKRSHRWYRVFNEVPVLLMAAALYLVIFKPF